MTDPKIKYIDDICTIKVMVKDPNSTTFKDVKKGQKLYNCIDCPGTYNSCPDYRSHQRLLDKYALIYKK